MLFLSLDLVISVQNPFSDYRANTFKYHATAQVAAAVTAAVLMTARTGSHGQHHAYGQDNFLAVCWIRQFDDSVPGGVSPWWWGLFNVPVACVYVFMLFALARVSRRLRQGLPASLSVRRSSLSAGRLYLTAYALYWTLSGVFYLACFTLNKDDPPLEFLIVFAGMFGLRGVVTLLVWVRSDEYRMLTKAWAASSTLTKFRANKRAQLQQQGYGSDAGGPLTPRQWAMEDDATVLSDASALPGGTALNDFASTMQPKEVQGGNMFEHAWAGGVQPPLALGSMHLPPLPVPAPPRKPSTGSLGTASTLSTVDSAAVRPEALEALHSRRAVARWRAVDAPDLRPHLNVALRKEMLFYTTLGIRVATAVQHATAATPTARASPLRRVKRSRLASGIDRVVIQLPRRHEIQGWSAAVAASAAAAAAKEERRWHAALTALAHDASPPPSVGGGGHSRSASESARLGASDLLDGGAGGVTIPVRGSTNAPATERSASASGPKQASSLGNQLFRSEAAPPSPPLSPGRGDIGGTPPRSGNTPLLRGFRGPSDVPPLHQPKALDTHRLAVRTREGGGAASDIRRQGSGSRPLTGGRSVGSSSSHGVSGGGSSASAMQQLLLLLEGGTAVPTPREGGSSAASPPLTREERLYGRRQTSGNAASPQPIAAQPSPRNARPSGSSGGGCFSWWGGGRDEACFEFLDYAPDVFAHIRSVSGVSDEEYITALEHTKREKFSEGASGAFLYFSADERYIVKTMTSAERTVLLGMLGAYAQHLTSNPGALLTRFLGCHTLVMYGTHMHFMVMKNVLHTAGTSIQERYDLKGSWVQRHRVPLERGARTKCRYCRQQFTVGAPRAESMCPARPNRTHVANTVLKDNDMNTKLHLPHVQTQALGRQLVADAKFLASQGIMDYSLLVGVHRSRFRLAAPEQGHQEHQTGERPSGHAYSAAQGARFTGVSPDDVPAYDAEARSLAHAAGVRLDAERAARLGQPALVHTHGPMETPHWGLTHDGMEQPGAWGEDTLDTPAVSEYDLHMEADLLSQRDERDFEPDDFAETASGVGHTPALHGMPPPQGAERGGARGAEAPSDPLEIIQPPRARAQQASGSGWSSSEHGTPLHVSVGGSLRASSTAGWGSLPGGGGVGSHSRVSTAFERLRQGQGGAPSGAVTAPHAGTRGRRDSTGATLFTGDGGGPTLYVEEAGGTQRTRQASDMGAPRTHSLAGSLPSSPRSRGGWTRGGGGPLRPSLDNGDTSAWDDIESARLLTGLSEVDQQSHVPVGNASASLARPTERPPPGTAAAAAGGSHATHDGGLRAAVVEAPSIYYIGIIDVLQEWTWGKWAERWAKVLCMWRASTGVSAIPPPEYAERFRARVVSQLLDGFVDGDVHPEHPRYAPFLR